MTTTAFSIELTRESLRVTNAMAGCFRIADLGTRGSGLALRRGAEQISNRRFGVAESPGGDRRRSDGGGVRGVDAEIF